MIGFIAGICIGLIPYAWPRLRRNRPIATNWLIVLRHDGRVDSFRSVNYKGVSEMDGSFYYFYKTAFTAEEACEMAMVEFNSLSESVGT